MFLVKRVRLVVFVGFLAILSALKAKDNQKVWESVDQRIQICKVDADSDVFKNLQRCYECEFAPVTQSKMDMHGNYDQHEIRSHWNEQWDAYVFYVDDAPAGFCVVNQGSVINENLKNDVNTHDMAEFFVAPFYRKKGYGTWFGEAVIMLHPGRWETRQLPELEQTSGMFCDRIKANNKVTDFVALNNHPHWEGFVQTFTVSLHS